MISLLTDKRESENYYAISTFSLKRFAFQGGHVLYYRKHLREEWKRCFPIKIPLLPTNTTFPTSHSPDNTSRNIQRCHIKSTEQREDKQKVFKTENK